jgi:phosphate transport system substrate-binding protein
VRNSRIVGAICVATAVAVAPANAAAKTVVMSGSTSVAPLAGALAKTYVKGAGKGTSFKLLQGGSDIGINDVSRGRVDIGNSSRDPKPSDPGGIVFNKIARDALCISTNPANPIANISQEQVQAIFSGRVRNWSEVPGAKVSGPISLVVRTPASGSQDAFQNIFMGQSLRVAGSASQKASNGLVQQTIRRDKNAIGYLSFDFVAGTHPLSYAGVACNLRNAKSGQYLGTRNFWMVTRGKPTGGVKKFISWIKSNPAARRITSTHWVALR